MPDLTTLISRQSDIVAGLQERLCALPANTHGDRLFDMTKSLSMAIDKYATLLYAERDVTQG